METGQITMQVSTGTASTGNAPTSAKMAAASAGESSGSAFAGKLHEMSSSSSGTAKGAPDAATKGKRVAADSGEESKDSKPADANSDIMAALLAMFGTQEQLAAGTQIVLPTGGNGGMSESGQKVETQDVGKNLPQPSVRLVGEVAIATKQGQPVELSQNLSAAVKPDLATDLLEAGGIKTETEEDDALVHLDTTTIKKNMESVSAVITKLCSSSTSENKLLDEGGKDASDNGMNGQFHQPATHQQVKTDTGISLGGTSGATPKDASQPDLSENVFLQVREALANRTIKAGNEQLTMKLSPEHLGELTINFKMENQHLKVEIIAASRGVRDALMQQSENLKESLARQNVNMDSFDVVMSGGERGFEQNNRGWKQLAQQQFMAGTSDGAYRNQVPDLDTDVVPRYGTQKQYAMVDVHY